MPDQTPSEAARPPTPSAPPVRRAGILLLAFGSGFSVLTIEIAGARVVAPVFGLSAVPWTAIIGVILAALAVGNHVGGRLADGGRVPLSWILLAAGLAGLVPIIGDELPWFAYRKAGFFVGVVGSALVLFAPSVLALGAVVPYLIRASTTEIGTLGRRAGDVSAAATLGSILGAFLTGFVLLPAFALPTLLAIVSAALFVMAGVARWAVGGEASAVPW